MRGKKVNYLTKKEFDNFKDNDFLHLCIDVSGVKKDVNWLKWLNVTVIGAVLVRLALTFFGI